ncbi:transcription factor Adf-1-like [Drosophila innubila]|uniref:transcription factor Adf-1-like n=1 Tax=Drosophila innubila TaxID=198719 RepID=UPI00148BA4F4|nr:transcription factor Adf-1-like [Drosophila innubila]
MDSVTLISEIKRMPALWDKQNKNFSNRIITTKNWQLIADKMGVTTDQCKKKFKYLKDAYRKAHRKMPRHASGTAASELYISKYKYYNLMMFLYDDVANSCAVDFQSSQDSLVDECSMSMSYVNDTSFEKTIMKQEIDNNDDFQLPGLSSKQDTNIERIEIEQKRLRFLEKDVDTNEDVDNDDLHFYKSLIPHTKGLSSVEKLRMRVEIQNIVLKYLEKR